MNRKAKLFVCIITLLIIIRIIHTPPMIIMASEIDVLEESPQENTSPDIDETTKNQETASSGEPDHPVLETENNEENNKPDENLTDSAGTEETIEDDKTDTEPEPGKDTEAEPGKDSEPEKDSVTEIPDQETDNLGSISGFLWVDGNGTADTDWDGIFNGDELPLPEYPVTLYEADDLSSPVAVVLTDSDGMYSFDDLNPGIYVAALVSSVVNEETYLLPLEVTDESVFEIDLDSDPLTAYTEPIELGEDQSIENINAGMRLTVKSNIPDEDKKPPCLHESHDEHCGYDETGACGHICEGYCFEQQPGPTDPPDEAIVKIIVGEDKSKEDLYIPQGEPVTEEVLLEDVYAVDETDEPVPVVVGHTGGLDMRNPQPLLGANGPEPYIITYEAVHTVTDELFTAERNLYVTELETIPPVTIEWSGKPPTVTDGDIVMISGSPSGTLVVPANAAITIIGTVTDDKTSVAFDIKPGAMIKWNASITGSKASAMVTLTGSGAFIMYSGAISNAGTGGTLHVNGAGSTITVNGGTITAGRGGNAILINANSITININAGGVVESLFENVNAAIQVDSKAIGTSITINGGTVISIDKGHAICDGAATGAAATNNNTVITINGGIVTSDGASAIRSSGKDSSVLINGGVVSGSATSEQDAVINMTGGAGLNVIVKGGTIQALGKSTYGIQTKGSVLVDGGTAACTSGRAINLVGSYSIATVNSGTVQAKEAGGVAISTTTTTTSSVANTSVIVNGGAVSSVNSYAINVTGDNSSVQINGGIVSGTTGDTIHASGKNAAVTVHGGQVTAATGLAINVSASAVPLLIDGGFVFAYGTKTADVISAKTISGLWQGGGVVIAWDHTKNVTTYIQDTRDDLYCNPEGNVVDYIWDLDPTHIGGIAYANGRNIGFYPINYVTVKKIVDITITNTVTGEFIDKDKPFTFTVYFKGSNSESFNTKEGFFENDDGVSSGVLSLDSDGKASFTLAHEQEIKIIGVASDASIRIVADKENAYQVSFTDRKEGFIKHSDNDTGVRPVGDEPRIFDFEHEFVPPVPTGVERDTGTDAVLMYSLLVIILSGLLIFETNRKGDRKREMKRYYR